MASISLRELEAQPPDEGLHIETRSDAVSAELDQDQLKVKAAYQVTALPDPPSGGETCQDSNPPIPDVSQPVDYADEDDPHALFECWQHVREQQPSTKPVLFQNDLWRLNFLHLNKQLAACKKRIIERRRASNADMLEIRHLLHEQAEAVRNYQYMTSLEFLPPDQTAEWRRKTTNDDQDVNLSQAVDFRYLSSPTRKESLPDQVRELLIKHLPSQITWSNHEERQATPELYSKRYKPRRLAQSVEVLARFLVAMSGALFILVPMYIMALYDNRTANLITTTIAVVLFCMVCSVVLQDSSGQGATAGYAAVLMLFVGVTS